MNNDFPVIKMFVHNNQYYVYDTYINKVLELDKALWCEVRKLQLVGLKTYRQMPNSDNKMVVMDLINKGFFCTGIIRRIEHYENDYIQDLIDRHLRYLQLQVTRDCNFMCRYCTFASNNTIERNHISEYMQWDVAKKSIDYFFEHSKENPEVSFSFYGGEPLLNFGLIKEAVSYIESIFSIKKVSYYITTNASLLNEEISDFFIEHDFNLTISLDGPSYIQNKHRKLRSNGGETFDIVIENILRIKNKNLNYFNRKITYNPVMFANESFDIVKKFYKDIGVDEKSVRKQYADVNGIDYMYSGIIFNEREESINELTELYQKTQIQNLAKRSKDIPMLSTKWHHNGVCVPGVNKLYVTVDGTFYPCEKCFESNALKIGNINEGFNVKRVQAMSNIGKLTEKQCKTCWAARFCSLCVLKCVDVENDMLSSCAKLENCSKQKEIIEKYIISML